MRSNTQSNKRRRLDSIPAAALSNRRLRVSAENATFAREDCRSSTIQSAGSINEPVDPVYANKNARSQWS